MNYRLLNLFGNHSRNHNSLQDKPNIYFHQVLIFLIYILYKWPFYFHLNNNIRNLPHILCKYLQNNQGHNQNCNNYKKFYFFLYYIHKNYNYLGIGHKYNYQLLHNLHSNDNNMHYDHFRHLNIHYNSLRLYPYFGTECKSFLNSHNIHIHKHHILDVCLLLQNDIEYIC